MNDIDLDAALLDGADPGLSTPPRDERREHQCSKDGCDSEAVYRVFLHFRYGRHLVATETMESSIRVCERHKKAAHDYILSEINKTLISREMAKVGRLAIDWPNAMIECVPIGEAPWGFHNMIKLQTGTA